MLLAFTIMDWDNLPLVSGMVASNVGFARVMPRVPRLYGCLSLFVIFPIWAGIASGILLAWILAVIAALIWDALVIVAASVIALVQAIQSRRRSI